MSSTTDRPVEYVSSKKYLGSFFADEGLEAMFAQCKRKVGLLWKPARPETYRSVINRLIQAFDVLRGKADALYWHDSFTK